MYILSVRIDSLTRSQALEKIKEFWHGNESKMVFTPNPEMLVDAQTDRYFQEVLNKGDLNVCDGKGIELVAPERIERIPGVDFMLDICRLAETENKSVYLLGGRDEEILKICRQNLLQKFPNLKIVGATCGPKIGKPFEVESEQNEKVIDDIIDVAPDILFVAFGHGKQEKWIYGFVPELPSIKIAMGVGGSFDFIAGKAKRAPEFLRRVGLEWLWRLIREPRRVKRIWKATVVFLFYSFFKK